MKKKRNGATLIVVVIIFAFTMTVLTAMLSMLSANYKSRIIESKRIQNLYGSESGLDVAYNIIGQTFNAAVKYGNIQVDKLTSENGNTESPENDKKYKALKMDIEYWETLQIPDDKKDDSDFIKTFKEENREKIIKDNEDIGLLINEEFKRSFNNFIYEKNSDIIDESKNSDVPENVDELAKSIVDKKYVNDNVIYEKVNFNNNDGEQDPTLFVYDDKTPTIGIDANKDKSGIDYIMGEINKDKSIDHRELADTSKLTIDVYDKQEYTVKVTSNFEIVSANGSSLRKIQATYTLKVPDYKQSLKAYKIFDNKSLIVGKNMNLNNANYLNVSGDIFVQGEIPTSEITHQIAYDKYLGGMKIDKSKNVNFNDDVITRSTFNILDQVGVDIKKNLYGRNVYAGKGKDFASGLDMDKSKLNISNDLVVDNDLTLKAHNTDITIKNFYGINDITLNNTDDSKKRNSSSIIVNKDKDDPNKPFTSSITITDEAWIMGAAYINTDGKYETGESIGVKGNYEAYSSSVASDASKNLSFSYDNPLYLINGSVIDKGEHFVDYWTNMKSNPDTGGIKLTTTALSKIHSIGAIVFKNTEGTQLQPPNYHIEDSLKGATIPQKQRDYASKVYKFGETATDNDYISGENGATNVSELMELSNMDNNYSLKAQETISKKAIFNKEDRKIIIRKTSGKDSIDVPIDNSSDIIIEAEDGKLDAVIATNGDVRIEHDVTFNGSIITNGNLEIEGNNITISQDSEVVKSVQAQNPDLFESVLKNGEYSKDTADYDLSNYLGMKLWKLIK